MLALEVYGYYSDFMSLKNVYVVSHHNGEGLWDFLDFI